MIARLPLPFVFLIPISLIFAVVWMVRKPPDDNKYPLWLFIGSFFLLWVGGTLNTFGHLLIGQLLFVIGVTGFVATPAYVMVTGKSKTQSFKKVMVGLAVFAAIDVALVIGLFRQIS